VLIVSVAEVRDPNAPVTDQAAVLEPLSAAVRVREIEENIDRRLARELAASAGISEIAARILVCRGILDVEAMRKFLTPNLREQLPNPATIKNILPAADLLLDFVQSGEQITVYNDFDVDGITSASQLWLYLSALGAKVNTYTPSRFAEGYGLVLAAVERMAAAGTKLLVTVDCGISSVKEFALAKRLGMKSIVLDHHIPGELPPADVVVDPAQEGCPFQEHKLAAAGLIWMLLIVLRQRAAARWPEKIEKGELVLPDPKDFLDLAALGTICDMVPLTGVNRVIAHRGVEALRVTRRPGIVALKQVAGVESNPRFGSGHVGFHLGPRINAAGRLAEASDVLMMLTTQDSDKAKTIASRIDRLNAERRRIEEEVRIACVEMLAVQEELLSHRALTIFGKDFHVGVIGIVAQRLVEQYHRPAAVMAPGEIIGAKGERKPVIKGSVRSVPGFHVAEMLQRLSHCLITHGGHSEAGGFSVAFEKLEEFQAGFVALANEALANDLLRKRVSADVEAEFSELDFELVNELMRFAPFGVGNPSPVLVSRGVNVESVSALSDKHLKVRFSQGRYFLTALCWGFQGHALLQKGERVSIAYQPEINTYQGVSSVQLNLREVWAGS